jgi:serine/threonine protein kinase
VAVAEHGPLPAFSVYRLLAGAAEEIAAVHAAGLIHRDLKPDNVPPADDGPRVTDFGLAQADSYSRLTSTGVAVGTAAYMAPRAGSRQSQASAQLADLGLTVSFAAGEEMRTWWADENGQFGMNLIPLPGTPPSAQPGNIGHR